MRLGIFGGTFNPIHLGHLLLAETARESLVLDRVLFVPVHQPPHKRVRDLLPGAVRLKLVQLAIRDHPAFVASDIELQRKGPSYSIETVKALHRQLPTAKLFLLIGQDMVAVRWFAWDELKRICTVVVAHRRGCLPASPPRRLAGGPAAPHRSLGTHVASERPASRSPEAGLKWLAMPQLDIASSDIRLRLKSGRSIRYLVPVSVERHIRKHRLYRGQTPEAGPGIS
jgi:nicotinate-nucleotide adenylyltransferase